MSRTEPPPIDCLAVMILKDYGRAERDFSHEYLGLFTGLSEHPRLRLRAFHPDLVAGRLGPDGMREQFRALVERDPPTLLIHHPFTEALDVGLDTLADLTARGVITAAFDADSSWRFDDWIRPRLGAYALSITTHPGSVPKYEAAGARVHLSQWAVSSWYRGYTPDGPRPLATSFVGQSHGDRRAQIARLRRAGLRVDCWGRGFKPRRALALRLLGRGANHGYAGWAEVRRALGTSRVSLNLANASDPARGNQIKGRHFEIPAFGACQLTTPADDLERYFEPEIEVIVAADAAALLEQARRLAREPARALRIAEAAWKRTWAEHTWARRIDALLTDLDL